MVVERDVVCGLKVAMLFEMLCEDVPVLCDAVPVLCDAVLVLCDAVPVLCDAIRCYVMLCGREVLGSDPGEGALWGYKNHLAVLV
jgi:hypothetical protein